MNGNTSRFMQKLMTGYTMYFNKRNGRTGVLFQGKFKSTHVEEDNYLKYLSAYIHLNPVKLIEPQWKEKGIQDQKSAQKYLHSYHYSSYLDYRGASRIESIILNKDAMPDYFNTPHSFKADIAEWLSFKEEL